MASKRPVPEHDTPPKNKILCRNKKHKQNEQTANATDLCRVRNKPIIEGDEDKEELGENAVCCKGKCDAWIHHKCVGLSKKQYEVLTEEDAPLTYAPTAH